MSKLCTFHIEYTPKLCLPLPKTLHTSSVSCSSLCWETVAFFLWLHWGEDCIEKVPSFSIHSVTWTSQSLRTMWTIVFWCKPFFFFLQLLVNCIFYIYIYMIYCYDIACISVMIRTRHCCQWCFIILLLYELWSLRFVKVIGSNGDSRNDEVCSKILYYYCQAKYLGLVVIWISVVLILDLTCRQRDFGK